jgi:glycerol kinase
MPLLLALDQGTTSCRAILFDQDGTQIALEQEEFPQHYPQPGWVEHDPLDIWRSQLSTARKVLQAAGPAEIAAIGITNQRETTLLWDRATGEPLHNAIVWQDRRTAEACSALKRDASLSSMIQRKTGLLPDAYFSASKLQWLLENVPGARDRARRGQLAFGTVDSWLLYNLTRSSSIVHATDTTNASRTMLFNIHTLEWDEELLALFDVPRALLPQVLPSAGPFGTTSLFGRPIPITGIAGDQQAALFGQSCTTPGLAKNTYGTGCFLLSNLGTSPPPPSPHQLLTTVAWSLGARGSPHSLRDSTAYALEGSVFVGGAVVQWLRDGLGLIKSAADVESLARSVPDTGGLYLVPAFAGLGAPHWDQYARGTILGITRGTIAGHFARAALESIAFQVADLVDTMQADAHFPMKELRVDGGAARNDLLLQFQADLLQIPVLRPKITETTALGAAFLAALGAGLVDSTSRLQALWQLDRTFLPQLTPGEIQARRAQWNKALTRARDWESHP